MEQQTQQRREAVCRYCGATFTYQAPATPLPTIAHLAPTVCPQCDQREQQLEQERRRRNELVNLGLPREYRDKSLDPCTPLCPPGCREHFNARHPSQAAARTACANLVADATLTEQYSGLLLWGPPGTGKTHLGAAVALQLGSDLAWWCNVAQLLDVVRRGYDSGDDSAWLKAGRVELLVLDDIGCERVTEWVAERLYVLLNERWNQGLPVLATTNYTPGDLAARLGDGVMSRLVGLCGQQLHMQGPDGRKAVA